MQNKMTKIMPSDFFRRVKPFLLVFMVFGFTSCKIVSGRLERTRTVHRIWGFILAAGVTTIVCIDISTNNLAHPDKGIFSLAGRETLELFSITLSGLLICFCLSIAHFRQSIIVAFYQNAENFDNRVEQLGHKNKNKFWLIWLCLAYECALAIANFSGTMHYYIIIEWHIVKCVFATAMRFMMIYLCLLTYIVYDRFRYFNNTLIPKLFTSNTNERKLFIIGELKFLHSILVNMAADFNKMYDPVMATWSVYIITEFTRSTYTFSRMATKYSILIVLWNNLFYTIGFIVLCDRISKEIWIEKVLYFHYHKVQLTAGDLLPMRLRSLLVILSETLLFYFVKTSNMEL